MFAIVGQVERPIRGREAFQEIDQVGDPRRPRQVGRRARRLPTTSPAPMAEAIRQALGGRPGPVLLSLAEDLLDEPVPDDARLDAGRPPVARATDEDIRAVIEFLASAAPPGHPGRRRRPARPDLDRADPLRRAPPGPGHRRLASRRRHLERPRRCTSGWPASGRPRPVRERLDAADALLVIGSPAQRADDLRLRGAPRPGRRWAHVDLEPGGSRVRPPPTISVTADAKAFLKAANERLLGRAVLDAALVARPPGAQRGGSGRLGGGVGRRRRSRGTAPASIPGGRSRRSAGSCPTTRS